MMSCHKKRKFSRELIGEESLYFCQIVDLAKKTSSFHLKILCKWFIGEYYLFNYGVKVLSQGQLEGHLSKFFDGYSSLRKRNSGTLYFSEKEWESIQHMIDHRYNLSSLGKGLKSRIQKFRKDPLDYVHQKEQHYLNFRKSRIAFIDFQLKDENFWGRYVRSYLIDEDLDRPIVQNRVIPWKVLLEPFYKMDITSSMEIWKSGDEIIGGRWKGGVPKDDRDFIRIFIEELYNDKYTVKRSDSRTALKNVMRAIGPLVNWREGKGDHFVSFYRNKTKINCTKIPDAQQLELLYEQCAHKLLFEIVLVLFCEHFMPVVTDFLDIMDPLTDISDELASCFSKPEFVKNSMPSYPMFITKDFCNEVHVDNDRSKFTMFMASNPTMENRGGDLVILNYGIKIPILDGDLFFVRGKDLHGTSYRSIPCKPVYVVGIAVNQKLGSTYEFVNSIE